MNVLGIDFSSFAIDLALVDENQDDANWTHIDLPGSEAFARTREIHDRMPPPSWYVDHGVYLVALERPFSSSRNDVVRLVEGAILACLPRGLEVWEVTQQQWKPRLGVKQKDKPTIEDLARLYPSLTLEGKSHGAFMWSQDALDAAAMAFWARDLNAEIVAGALAS